MSYRFLNTTVCSLIFMAIAACTCYREKPNTSHPQECPTELAGAIRIEGIALPIELAKRLDESKGPLDIEGTLARRILLSIAPINLPPGTRIIETNLSLFNLGGTFQGWTQLQTDYTRISPSEALALVGTRRDDVRFEIATVRFEPGLIQIHRVALKKANLAGTIAVDILMIPGGIPVDETVLRVPKLWYSDKRPIEPQALDVQLVPLRHMAGYDQAEALVELNYVVELGQGNAYVCSAAADEHVVVLDRDAVRPPYWDLGVTEDPIEDSSRNRWLALSSPSIGAVRAVFESPSAANAFATWMRMTRAAVAGPYALGVFNGPDPVKLRPSVPVDKDIFETFRPLSPDDRERMRVGPLGDR